MEDILASIRRILNDDAEAEPTAPPPVVVAGEPAALPAPPEPGPEPLEEVFVLEQSMLIEETAPMETEEKIVAEHFNAEPEALPVPPAEPDEPLLAASAAAAANASLGALVRVVSARQTPVYRGGPSLEDIVREEIRPLVKAWLDEHLPPMVERMVRAEIERVTRA
jgi:cell pole-organizing protein PopZ